MTSVSTATLRAWERRYGVPTPSRTASAYRLYGDDDVALIAHMRDLVESGVAPAEAARALREHHSPGSAEASGESDAYQTSCERILDAVQRFDVENVRQEVARALTLGPAVAIFERALGPALRRVGELWLEGQITVAQEHILSNILLGRVTQLVELLQPVDASRKVALGCFETEEHVIGLHGVAMHFAAWGYKSVFLGARTPPDAVARVVSTLAVDAVALSITVAPPAPEARKLVDAYADACRDTAWIVGGQGANDVRRFVEARGGIVADDMAFSEVRRALDRAIRRDRPSASNSHDPSANVGDREVA